MVCSTDDITKCARASSGYFIDNGVVESCAKKYPNCRECDAAQCSKCLNGQKPTDGECSDCTATECTNCVVIDGVNYCEGCQGGFVLNEKYNGCISCQSIGCDECGMTVTGKHWCNSCLSGYYWNTSQVCTKCTEKFSNCKECTESQCDVCDDGYHLSNNECVQCEGCSALGCKDSICYSCQEGFVRIADGQCVDLSTAHCLTAESGRCITCDNDYINISGVCVATVDCTTEGSVRVGSVCIPGTISLRLYCLIYH